MQVELFFGGVYNTCLMDTSPSRGDRTLYRRISTKRKGRWALFYAIHLFRHSSESFWCVFFFLCVPFFRLLLYNGGLNGRKVQYVLYEFSSIVKCQLKP